MYETRAIEKNIDRAEFVCQRVDGIRVANVEHARLDRRIRFFQFFEEIFADVGGEHLRTFARKCRSRSRADALPGGGNQCSLSLEAAGRHG